MNQKSLISKSAINALLQDYDSRRAIEPLPGAWRTAKPLAAVEPADYYSNAGVNDYRNAPRDTRYDYGSHSHYEKPEVPSLLDRNVGDTRAGYDRYNGTQPVYPPVEERQMLAGGDLARKRPLRESDAGGGGGGFYYQKMPRTQETRPQVHISSHPRFSGDSADILAEESRKCVAEMSQELAILDSTQASEVQHLMHTRRLLNEEINKVTTNTNPDWIDVESNRSHVKVLKRVLLPKTRPGFNIVGRLMGVGGSTLRKMCQTYKCSISICGAGSRKNFKEEAELLRSGDPRYNHLACPLHAEVATHGPPHLAYTRLGQILTLINKIITCEEPFEQDGMTFDTTGGNYARRHEEDDGDQYKKESGSYRGVSDRRGGVRGRGRGHHTSSHESRHDDRRRSSSPQQGSWRDNGAGAKNEEEPQDRGSPKPATASRGRGRGGFVPRGGRGGGFVPRARNE